MEDFSTISAKKENTYSNFDDMSSCLSDESENDDLD